jgi:hypothetical protein
LFGDQQYVLPDGCCSNITTCNDSPGCILQDPVSFSVPHANAALQMAWSDLQPAASFKTMSSAKSGSFKVAADTAAAAAAASAAANGAECVDNNCVVLEQGPTCLPPADPANTVQGKCTASRRE